MLSQFTGLLGPGLTLLFAVGGVFAATQVHSTSIANLERQVQEQRAQAWELRKDIVDSRERLYTQLSTLANQTSVLSEQIKWQSEQLKELEQRVVHALASQEPEPRRRP